MSNKITAVTAILVSALIAGCGGGTGSTPAASSTTSVSGKVADGYLANATVFLDKNGNYQLDAGEPSDTTDANGAYSLTVDPADVGRYPIVAIAVRGVTIDMDNPTTPIASSYVLSLPAAAISGTVSSNFISPMSSQLREMMEIGKYATMQDAMNDLRRQLGMPAGTDMLTDYMAAGNTTMHTMARSMASLMGGQMAQVMATSGSTTTVDVNRYRGMMGTIFSNMSSLRGPNAQSAMPGLTGAMADNLANMPMTTAGQPFRNMSAAFRGGMMGGTTSPGTGGGRGSMM